MFENLPDLQHHTPPEVALRQLRAMLECDRGYEFADIDEQRPWGAYYRVIDDQTSLFLKDFFPDLSEAEAKLGREDVMISPKIMIIFPGQRLSWQYHHRRAERQHFLTEGKYYRSTTDDMGEAITAPAGTIVQFEIGERHRLAADDDDYTVVAEIWQHVNRDEPSEEADIVRVQDDYQR